VHVFCEEAHEAVDTAATLESRLDEPTAESGPDVRTGRGAGSQDVGWRRLYDEVVADLRAALAATPAEPDPTAHRLPCSLAHLAFARREFLESVGHYRSAAERAEDGVAAALELRSAADATVAISDGQTGVELLLDAAGRAVANSNVRATMLALAVIAVNRYPNGSLFELPGEETERLLAEAVNCAVPGDLQVAALLAAAKAWEHGGRAASRPTPSLRLRRSQRPVVPAILSLLPAHWMRSESRPLAADGRGTHARLRSSGWSWSGRSRAMSPWFTGCGTTGCSGPGAARALRVARSEDLAGAPWLIAPQLFAQARVALELRDDRVVARKQKGAIVGEEHMLRGAVEPRLDRPVYLADLPESLELGRNENSGDGCIVIHV
jgi:hypothetical protein